VIKDAADLFAAKGEEARDAIENLKIDAQDALDLALSEAPSSGRERYLYATERIFPLLLRLEDEGERGAALDDVAGRLGLRKTDLRGALAKAVEAARQDQEDRGRDEEGASEDLGPEPGTERHERAMELLRCPDILEAAARDMERLGHVGERTAKKLAFVCAVSARAGYPIQPSTHAESSTGKNYLWDTALSLLPQRMVLRWSAMSDKALFFTEEDLKGKVIYLQEVAGSEGADFAIRVLQSAQYLEYVVTEKTADGAYRAVTYRKEGPVVVVQTTTQIRLFNENDTRVFPIYLDESPEQTARIVENALLRAESGGTTGEALDAVMGLWHDAIGLLEPAVEVVVPFARRIKMPTHRVRMRRDVNRLLDVIRVLAWLQQHARERDELGRILATEEDFRAALALVSDSLGRAWDSMTPVEEAVMDAIRSLPEAIRKNGFKRGELRVEGQDARRMQDALKALTDSGHIECEKRGGPGGYRYTVPRAPTEARLGISLSPADDDDGNEAEGPDAAAEEDPAQAGDQGEDDEEGDVARGIARTDERVIEGPLTPGKGAIARSRGVDDEGPFEDDDPEEEEEVDCLGELTGRGWYRAESAFVTENVPEGAPPGEERATDALRRRVPIYHGGRAKRKWHVGDDTPLVLSAEEVTELEPEEPPSGARPTTPEEMGARLGRLVNLLQQKVHRFYDPNFDEWCFERRINAPLDSPNRFKEAYLHAELWRNGDTGVELWALVALREGRRVPEEAIEEAVWSRAAARPMTDETALEVSDNDFEF
jgi:hypothetical protein